MPDFSDDWLNNDLRELVAWVYGRETTREENYLRKLFGIYEEGGEG